MSTIPLIFAREHADRDSWLKALQAAIPQHQLVDAARMKDSECHGIKVAITANPAPDDVLRFPDLLWVQSLWAGVEGMLGHESLSHLDIVRLIDPLLADTMAEAALAWTLYLHRDMPTYRQQQNQHCWKPQPWKPASERHVGVLGCGELGMAAIKKLTDNNFKVSGWSRSPRLLIGATHLSGEEGLETLLATADIVLLLLPLTPETRHLINAERLKHLKPQASLINFGRGGLINADDLLARLDAGAVKHAVLDVFETEPLPAESPLWAHSSVTVLPHISAPTPMRSAAKTVAENINRWFEEGVRPTVVNRAAGY